jgi:hypothetical protein
MFRRFKALSTFEKICVVFIGTVAFTVLGMLALGLADFLYLQSQLH